MPRTSRRRPFVAIDFETASNDRNSACSVALVRVESGRIVHTSHRLIRPPARQFLHTGIHGIAWKHVCGEPTFDHVWRDLASMLQGVAFLAAHNAPFDRSVLRACCRTYGFREPAVDWVDTVKVARQAWDLRPTRLPDVCEHLGLPLNHHDALSDASACAQIVVQAGVDQ